MDKALIVVGFSHTLKSKTFPKVLEYINENVKSGEKIAVESPFSLEKIADFSLLEKKQNLSRDDLNNLALYSVCKKIQEKEGVVIPVEDSRLYRFAALHIQWYR